MDLSPESFVGVVIYLIENGLTMLVGNGTWYIFDEFEADEWETSTGTKYNGGVDVEDLPEPVKNAMMASVLCMRNGELGVWMPDFRYPAYQANEENKETGRNQ